MTNFIFKSAKGGLVKKFANTIEIILSEQRHQRADLNEIKFMLHKLITNKDLKDTTDKFYSDAAESLVQDPYDPN